MPDNIDSISIELTADISSAEESLNKLIGRLALLKVAVQGASNFTKIAGGIQRIAEAARKIETDSGEKLSNLAHGLMELSKVGDLSHLGSAAKNLSSVIKAASSSGNSANFGSLANGIRGVSDALGGITDSDVDRLGAVSDALSGETSGPIHTSSIGNESAEMGGGRKSFNTGGDMAAYGAMTVFKYVADSIRDATSAYHEFQAALGGGVPPVFTEFVDEARQSSEAMRQLSGGQNAMTVFKYVADNVRDASNAYREFAGLLGGGRVFTEFADDAERTVEALRMLPEGPNWRFGDTSESSTWVADEIRDASNAASDFGNTSESSTWVADEIRDASNAASDFGNTGSRSGAAIETEFTNLNSELNRTSGLFNNLKIGALNLGIVGVYLGSNLGTAIFNIAKGVAGLAAQIVRIGKYRLIRAMLKDMTQSFKDLYGWSKLYGTDFAKSMDRITTASVYLRNSLAAMVAPLVNLFAPALDMLADKIVDILNFVNQLFAAINGQETYTVAKKVATTWESTFDSAANHANKRIKEVRNTLLGFDEINRLNGETPTTSGSTGSSPYTPGYSTMFEEKPLEGFFEKISNVTSGWPDWLKWLFGIGTVAIGAWGISKLPGLIGKIFDAFKNLFSITLPDWLRWLFGPKGDNDIGLDIPDKIDLPDADVPVNLKQGDWSVLQQIPSEKYLLLKVGVKMDGWLGNGNPQLPGNQPLVIDDDGSGTWDFTFQQAAMGANNLQAINNQLENMVDNWDDLAWEVAKMASGKVIDRTLRVAVKRSDSWDKTAWDAANFSDGNITRTVTAVVGQGDWDKTAWLAATMTPYTATRTIKTVVEKGSWDNTAWLAANMTPYTAIRTVKVETEIGVWDAVAWLAATLAPAIISRIVKVEVDTGSVWTAAAWLAATMATATIIRTVISEVKKGEWDNTAWTAATMTTYTVPRTVTATVKKGEWDATAWTAALMTAYAITRTVTAIVKKGEWDATAWSAANMTSYSPTRTVTSVVKKGAWDDTAWTAATMTNYTVTRTVNVELKKKDWTTVTDFVDDSFGGATGGGGKTSGGGAGRNRSNTYNIPVDVAPAWASTVGGLIPYLGLNDLTTSITTALKKVSEWKTQGIGKYLDITTQTPKVNVDLKKKWGKKTPVDYLGLSGLSTTIKVGLRADGSKLKLRVSKGEATLQSAIKRTENVEQTKALGGVFSNGRWSRIPQYAGGTTNAHGSLFLAGEAGPEIVGHVGGRTEVLNKSQLASAMYAAVTSAMAPASMNFAAAAANMNNAGDNNDDMDMLMDLVRRGSEATERQNELLRQQNDYLRSINDKDFAPEISTSSINKAQQRMNRRAGTTIVPVGT